MILFVDSEGPDQTVEMSRLIWVFTVPIREDIFSHGAAHIKRTDGIMTSVLQFQIGGVPR